MEVQGRIIVIGEVLQVTEKFSKRDFVVETDEQYPQQIKLELHQHATDLIDPYKIGELVTVSFNLRGRGFTDKDGNVQYANTLQAWKIQR